MADGQTLLSQLSLKEQLEIDRKERAEEFAKRFSDLCNELECDMIGVPRFTDDGRITVQFSVQPR